MVAVLILLISVFLLFQRIPEKNAPVPVFRVPALSVTIIPRTVQKTKTAPPPEKPVIPVSSDEIDILDNIPVHYPKKNRNLHLETHGAYQVEELPYVPRQILEVLPANCGQKIQGRIDLALLIDTEGHVKDVRVLKNTTASDLCLKNVLQAVHQSRWEAVTIDVKKVSYWISKSYVFGSSETGGR